MSEEYNCVRILHAECGVIPYYRGERREPGVGIGAAGNGGFGSGGKEGAACSSSRPECPNQHGNESDWNEYRFGHEEEAKFVGVHV